MPDRVPAALLTALTRGERAGLLRALDLIGPALADLYADEVADHREARGDNGQLFGMKIWTHGWFRFDQLFAEEPGIEVVAANGSKELRIGRLRIGIYRQGAHVDDDVHHNIPHADSQTKRSYGANNAAQLALFDSDLGRPAVDEQRISSLFDLTCSHFGNPRDGLVKWYVGAQSEPGRWGWVNRQPDSEPGSGAGARLAPVTPLRPAGGIVPFDQRPVQDVEVRPRRRLGEQDERDRSR